MKRRLGHSLLFLWGILVISIMCIFYLPKCIHQYTDFKVDSMDVWMKKTNGNAAEEMLLPEKISMYDSVELSTYLSKDFQKAQELCFWTDDGTVEIILDSAILYSTEDDIKFGERAISKWHFVQLPEYSEGKELKLKFSFPLGKERVFLDEVIYGEHADIQKWIIASYGINYIFDLTLIIAGIAFIFCGLNYINNQRHFFIMLLFGSMSILSGVGLRAGTKGIPMLWMEPYTKIVLSSLIMLIAPILLTMYVRLRIIKVKLLRRSSEILLAAECVFVLMVIFIQALGIYDFYKCMIFGQFLMIISVVWAMGIALFWHIKIRDRRFWLTVIKAILLVVIVGINAYRDCFNRVRWFNDYGVRPYIVLIILLECVIIYWHFKENAVKEAMIQKENHNLHIQVLTKQIRPHFILNTLGAIRNLIRQDPDRASDLLYDFSKYLRRNMEEKNYSKVVPFLEELDYIETYLKLEKARFNEKLTVKYNIQEDNFWILPLTIQPFVENAVKHGLLEKKQGGIVWISTYSENDSIVIEIKDNGVGFDTRDFWEELKNKKSIGMKSAIYRLQDQMQAKIEVTSSMNDQDMGTRIRIRITKERAKKYENNNCR